MYVAPFVAGQKLVELGGGDKPLIRPNIDVRPGPSVDQVADLNEPLPLADESFDGVYSCYSAEHVSWRNVRRLFAECRRILRPGGAAVFIVPNLLEQARVLASKRRWEDNDICMVFGDQNYGENAHSAGWSPEFALRVMREAGFDDVLVLPHPQCRTDMILEARVAPAPAPDPDSWTPEERARAYNREYFDGGRGGVGGYAREGYWDYPVHWTTARRVLERKPESVLEIGCARGYILKRLEDAGVRVAGLEVSEHCRLTRACENVITWDATQTPWPFEDGEFDLALTMATLEHIPEQHVEAIAAELARVCKRGLHGIDFGEDDDGFDKTHCTLRPPEWWRERLPAGHEVVDKEDLERGPVTMPPDDGALKLNVGSFTTMFHHGWTNVDQHDLAGWAGHQGYKYRQADVRAGLPWPDGAVAKIYASHFLEHLTVDEGRAFLAECHRALAPGGLVRLAVPDLEVLARRYLDGTMGGFDELNATSGALPAQSWKFWELLTGGHRTAYDWPALHDALRAAGFETVERSAFRQSRDASVLRETVDMLPDLSLYVEAVKA